MNTMKRKRVGLIGLGDMGMGMARNLQAAGFPLTGLDLRAERMALLRALGGAAADNAAQLGRASDVVILMVFSGQQTYCSCCRLRTGCWRACGRAGP